MNKIQTMLSAMIISLPLAVAADDDLTRDAAISGAIGGALGGAIGAELGGKDGAVVGAGIGAAVGTQVGTEGTGREGSRHVESYGHQSVQSGAHSHGSFCPPGQAKKGRC